MNTPTHAILNLAILGKKAFPQANLIIAIGGIFPDIPIFIFYFWAKFIQRLPESQIWREAYYQPFWQNITALFHSIPIACIGVAIAYFLNSPMAQVFCLSLILHSLLDLPVHHDDAHRHFFPFSNYRFISPISYWDTRHYGGIVMIIEWISVIVGSVYCFSLVQSWIGRGLMIAINIFYTLFIVLFLIRSWQTSLNS